MAEASQENVVNQAQSVDESSSIDVSGTSHIQNDEGVIGEDEKSSLGDIIHADTIETAQPISEIQTPLKEVLPNNNQENIRPVIEDASSMTQPAARQHDGTVNGENVSYDGSDDIGYQHSASGDTVHSDPDTIRVDGAEQSINGGIGDRSGAIKKPTSFKTVSVTKNFLAKSAAGTIVAGKPTIESKAIPTATNALVGTPQAKPRLVAKTGKDTRLLGVGTRVSASGPDASKVWNRNKPAVLPPPKQFTDEELKQQYGIHLATRLQADEAGKEGKWADIDDDEDDWAPEATVEWMDGTKSTAALVDGKAIILDPNRTQVQPAAEQGKPPAEGTESVARSSSITSMGKTILRPGVRTISSTKPGVVLKSVPEGPTQQERASASSTSKSPWAPLPPVDKVFPISFNPPLPTTSQALNNKDNLEADRETVGISPAREIAADDFNRGHRESRDGDRRELFNSQSGRYEPVKGSRRLSRHEPGVRPSAVLLQRSSQQGVSAPADASPVSQQSGDVPSGLLASPHQASKLPDVAFFSASKSPGTRTGSQQENMDGQIGVAPGSQTPKIDNGETSAADLSAEDIRAVQQRLMREKIELNRKRKQEEEAREEAERKERIRIKMEALGMPTTKDGTSSKPTQAIAGAESKEEKPGTQQPITTENHQEAQPHAPIKEHARPEHSEEEPQAKRAKALDGNRALPQPSSNSAPAQSEPRAISDTKSSTSTKSEQSRFPFGASSIDETKSSASTPTTPPSSDHLGFVKASTNMMRSPLAAGQRMMQGRHDMSMANSEEVQQLPGLGTVSPVHHVPQPWSNSGIVPDPPLGWSNNGPMSPSNVWGPPRKDRPLGNGSFDQDFQRTPPIQRPIQSQSQANPFALRSSPQALGLDFNVSQPLHAMPQTARQDDIGHAPDWQSVQQPSPNPNFSTRNPGYSAPQQNPQIQSQNPEQALKQAWKGFGEIAPQLDARAQHIPRRTSVGTQPTFKETFRQTTAGDTLGNRQVVSVSKTIHEGQNNSIQGEGFRGIHPDGQAPPVQLPTPTFAPLNNRSSRFFGPTADRSNSSPLISAPVMDRYQPEFPSTPPPDSVDHPAFGRVAHPLVHLPSPAPKVRLPPQPPQPAAANTSDISLQANRFRSGPQPIVSQLAWQDRFKSLFHGSPSTPSSAATYQVPVQQVLSMGTALAPPETLSKVTLDVAADAATVSLPHHGATPQESALFTTNNDPGAESKTCIEELMDDRQLGDKPTVYLPKFAYQHLHVLRNMANYRLSDNRKYDHVEVPDTFRSTADEMSFDDLDAEQKVTNGIKVLIRLLGRELRTKILMHKFGTTNGSRFGKNPRNQKRNVAQKIGNRAGTKTTTTENGNQSPHTGHASKFDSSKQRRVSSKPGDVRQDMRADGSNTGLPSSMPPAGTAAGISPQHSHDASNVSDLKQNDRKRNTWARAPRGPSGRGGFKTNFT